MKICSYKMIFKRKKRRTWSNLSHHRNIYTFRAYIKKINFNAEYVKSSHAISRSIFFKYFPNHFGNLVKECLVCEFSRTRVFRKVLCVTQFFPRLQKTFVLNQIPVHGVRSYMIQTSNFHKFLRCSTNAR